MRPAHLKLAFVLCGLLFLSGCGGDIERPEIATVTGTVTLDGNPIDHGIVYFYPDSTKGTKGPMAMAEIGPDGKYSIKSAGDRDGAIIGFHQIRVEIRQPPKDERDTQPELMTLPKFNDQKQSGLTGEVKAGTENVIDLPVTSK
jgi:hypothetical protein